MIRLIRIMVLFLMASLCTSYGQLGPQNRYDLLEQAIRDGPGKEEISDPFDVLRNDPELRAELTQAIRNLEDKYGFRMRVLLRPIWMGWSVQELAAALQDIWFPKGDGLVLVIETDDRKLGLGISMHGVPQDETWKIPTHVSAVLINRVAENLNSDLPLDEYLRSVVLTIASEHNAFLKKRMAPTSATRIIRENIFFIGALLLASFGAVIVAVRVRRSQSKEKLSLRRFPRVVIPERFGARHGGGTIATRKFQP